MEPPGRSLAEAHEVSRPHGGCRALGRPLGAPADGGLHPLRRHSHAPRVLLHPADVPPVLRGRPAIAVPGVRNSVPPVGTLPVWTRPRRISGDRSLGAMSPHAIRAGHRVRSHAEEEPRGMDSGSTTHVAQAG